MGDKAARTRANRCELASRRSATTSNAPGNAADRVIALQREAGNKAILVGFDVAEAIVLLVDGIVEEHGEGILGFDAWASLRLALLNAASTIGTAEVLADAALIEAETDRIRAESASLREEVGRLEDHHAGHPGGRPFERLEVLAALAGGETSDVELTDIVFLTRHPERRQSPLEPGKRSDASLIQEWGRVRTSIVGPVLSSALGKAVRLPKGKPKEGAGTPKQES